MSFLPHLSTVWIGLCLASINAKAQQAFQNAMAIGNLSANREKSSLVPQDALFKSGDFTLQATPSLEMDWNDNVTAAQTARQDDYIIQPFVQLTAGYPLTDFNELSITAGIGYQEYLRHRELSSLQVQAGTGPSLDIFVKGFDINLHDYISYEQDSSQQPLVAGTADFGTMNNTAGIRVAKSLGAITPSIGYDHQIQLSTTGQFQSQNRQTELLFAKGDCRLDYELSVGLELGAAFTRYEQTILNDNNNYSAGMYADWRPDEAFHIQPRAGCVIYQFQHSSQSLQVPILGPDGSINPVVVQNAGSIQTSDLCSWYANMDLVFQITKGISYTVSAGHEIQAGLQSDAVKDWFARSTINWDIMKGAGVSAALSYEHGNQGVGNIQGNSTEIFDWFGGTVVARYKLAKRADVALSYRLTVRSSDQALRSYTQNVIGVAFTYYP